MLTATPRRSMVRVTVAAFAARKVLPESGQKLGQCLLEFEITARGVQSAARGKAPAACDRNKSDTSGAAVSH